MRYVPIGKIVNTHGLKGEVKVESWSDFDDVRYELGNTIYVETKEGMLPLQVASYRIHKNHPLVSFADYQDINAVEPFKFCVLYIKEEDRHTLPEGKFYVDQLIGLKVYEVNGDYIGEVIGVEETNGAQKNLRVQREGQKDALIPNVPAFVKKVDLEKQRIEIEAIEGLL
ncbi:MAG: ribosome maturation factor RimM [Solobacterium sp.]|nr:ribosome maturation factor RimM [Solobacterium sp.]